MIRYGIISDFNPANVLVKVYFEEDDLTTGWIPVIGQGSLKNKTYWIPDENENVVCLMDDRCEDGVVLGSIYSTQDTPGFSNRNFIGTKFDNGDEIYYDRQTGVMNAKIGTFSFCVGGSKKVEIKNAVETLGAILQELITQIQAITVSCSAPGSPSSMPINTLAFVPIIARLNALLS